MKATKQCDKETSRLYRYFTAENSKSNAGKLKFFLLLSAAATGAALSIYTHFPWRSSQVTLRSLSSASQNLQTDPADDWKDDVWPLRPPTPWDISTDFPYPREIEYDVEEGTWLRLDVHPKSGDVVFDMLGDLYCLPSQAYLRNDRAHVATAHPILLGVPHDSDPHFSPEGDRIVFRSDAELGVENIWVMKWTGCEAMNLRPSEHGDQALVKALSLMKAEEDMLASGVKESNERKWRRLVREGRLGARRVTNETYRWVSDAHFHPSGTKVVATKWYTSRRSIGAGEGWEYSVPSLDDDNVRAMNGKRLVGRTLPLGWTADQYAEQQIGPEQFIWKGNDSLIYAKNVRNTDGTYTYSKDVHKGIYSIFSRNMTTNKTETLVDAFPGGASRPELSRDGRTLAFVRRVRDKEALVLKDMVTGTLHNVWHGLTYDASAISAPMGTYPSFSFTPSDDAIIIWSSGQIYRVPLSANDRGEKTSSGTPEPILFRAHIHKRLAVTATADPDIVGLESSDTQRIHAFKEISVEDQGTKVVFQAAGKSFVQEVGKGHAAVEVPVVHKDEPYYSPSFVPNSDELILHARWSDVNFTGLELAHLTSGEAYEIQGLPMGRYYSPILCECIGVRRKIAFVKHGGDYLSGDIVATAGAGLYLGEIVLPTATMKTDMVVRNLRFIPTEIDTDEYTFLKMRFMEGSAKLLVQQSRRSFIVDLAAGPNELGDYKHSTVALGKMSTQLAVSPQTSDGKLPVQAQHVAFVDFMHVYVVSGDHIASDEAVWSKPTKATKGLARMSLDGGHDIAWSRDGTKLFWFLGAFLHTFEVSKLNHCASAIAKDTSTFGISCITNLVQFQEVVVSHSTDIQRLKGDAKSTLNGKGVDSTNADILIVTNATILTMDTGLLHNDWFQNAALITKAGIIESIEPSGSIDVPSGASVIDAQGGFVVPGFIDAHAHWNGFEARYPARSWELETFLAYGVTTMHNPSASNVNGFVERSRVENGQLVGPRIFQVGDIIYGAGSPSAHQDIADDSEAYSALVRIKAEGGPASFSYKNYNLPSRASRQRLLLAARNLSMICVPEGGMNQDWDLTYIVDGMTTVEHPLPVPVLYDDVLTLYAMSGTASTPTHLVNYGGVMGEQLVWATEDVPNDAKLRRLTRHDILEGLSESTARPLDSYALFNTSTSVAKMVGKGLRALIGAHGEPPLGLNYHAEMFFTQQGGLSNYEVIRAATSDAAKTLGLHASLGSLVSGKLADYLVYMPEVDLLDGDIRQTRNIRYVARGGRVWDASTMVEVWPIDGRKYQMPPLNPE